MLTQCWFCFRWNLLIFVWIKIPQILIDNRTLIMQSVYVYLRTYDPDSSVGVVTGLRARRPETLVQTLTGMDMLLFSTISGPLYVLHNLLSNGYQEYSGRSVKLTTRLHLVLKVKKYWSYTSIPVCVIPGEVFNWLCTGYLCLCVSDTWLGPTYLGKNRPVEHLKLLIWL
jgi:hypothetical protein